MTRGQTRTRRKLAGLGVAVLVLGPFVGVVTLILALSLSGATFEGPDNGSGSGLGLLALLVPVACGLIAFRVAKWCGAGRAGSLLAAVLGCVWPVGSLLALVTGLTS